MRRFRLAACKGCVKPRVAPPALRCRSVPASRAARGFPAGGLLLVGLLLAGPGAGGAGEGRAQPVADQRARPLKDRALQRSRRDDLDERCLTVSRLGWLLVVDQPPHLLEHLLADEA